MENIKEISLLRKISVTLICILSNAGIVYFVEAFKHFTPQKVNEILFSLIFGIGFAYYLGYKLEITPKRRFKSPPRSTE